MGDDYRIWGDVYGYASQVERKLYYPIGENGERTFRRLMEVQEGERRYDKIKKIPVTRYDVADF